MRACFIAAALLMFGAGFVFARAETKDYTVVGTLKVVSDDENKQVCEIRIGSSTDSRKKLLLVSAPDMQFTEDCRAHQGNRVRLTIAFAQDFHSASSRQDGE